MNKTAARHFFSATRPQALVLALAFAFSVSTAAPAQSKQNEQFPAIKIKNFGRMDDRFYRGAQPDRHDYKSLAELGINTIIDLRDDPTRYEKQDAEALGMHYINIPMSDTSCPTNSQIEQFLKLVSDPATGKFYVHCAGGRHRTGVIGAVYRYNFYDWNYDQVYKEMKSFDFYTRWGHAPLKEFVENYYRQIQAAKIPTHVNAGAIPPVSENSPAGSLASH